ncbi:sigma-70 family RNA polymerase sigma factor [Variovorax sp. tm]|uniref:sigma-70 family RNA polymerase sigma factor n=1 Tax=Variovorax atrisoli TaxID=3394203 RepID=UPI003A809858
MARLRSALQTPPPPPFDAAAELLDNAGDVLPGASDPTAVLWDLWRNEQDQAAREQLICHYLPYARMVAATVYGRRTHNDVEFADYLQLARVGLLEAVDRFEPGQGAQFKTFAAKRVQGAVLNGLARFTEKNQQISVSVRLRQDRLGAVKEAAADEAASEDPGGALASASTRSADKLFKYLAEVGIGLALGVMLEDTGMVDAEAFDGNGQVPSAEVSYFRKTEIIQLRTVLRELVSQLSEQQRLVIRHHYLQEIPFDEIAALMGVTRGRVSQLHRQGLTRLRELLGRDARCDVSW